MKNIEISKTNGVDKHLGRFLKKGRGLLTDLFLHLAITLESSKT